MQGARIVAIALSLGAVFPGVVGCASADAADSAMSGDMSWVSHKGSFLKGQLHAHSSGSLDSETPPEKVVRWYSQRGFDFLVLTDHNRITRASETPTMLVLPGVELTINLRSCDPPPPRGMNCLLHMNALLAERPFEREPWSPRSQSVRREDLYGLEVAKAIGLGAVPQLNHPNFHFAANEDLVLDLAARGVAFMEIANEAHDSMNDGDSTHESTERLWDAALTKGARLLGTATDDAHDYFDDPESAALFPKAYTGDRGFVMVRADRTARSIREALVRGDFYASTGVILERADVTPEGIALEAYSDKPVWFEVIGDGGGVFRAEAGRKLEIDPRTIPSTYVRVRVTDAAGRHAWTQPVFKMSL